MQRCFPLTFFQFQYIFLIFTGVLRLRRKFFGLTDVNQTYRCYFKFLTILNTDFWQHSYIYIEFEYLFTFDEQILFCI